ncbi:hypothetical protein DYC54_04220 [Vibrio cholerae]|nr:hypothetical protein [Vibrio cholerae]EGR2462420.1 hypothetical protein [Vibrio cholerae]TXZ15394.1 hypothetical protein FXE59_05840 [Vibrio cholerae]
MPLNRANSLGNVSSVQNLDIYFLLKHSETGHSLCIFKSEIPVLRLFVTYLQCKNTSGIVQNKHA